MTRVRGASFTALVLVALGATAGLAPRAGDLDPAFGNGGRGVTPVGGGESGLASAVTPSDGGARSQMSSTITFNARVLSSAMLVIAR